MLCGWEGMDSLIIIKESMGKVTAGLAEINGSLPPGG